MKLKNKSLYYLASRVIYAFRLPDYRINHHWIEPNNKVLVIYIIGPVGESNLMPLNFPGQELSYKIV